MELRTVEAGVEPEVEEVWPLLLMCLWHNRNNSSNNFAN